MSLQHKQPLPRHDDPPLPVDPGHVRQRQHYEALLPEQQKEKAER